MAIRTQQNIRSRADVGDSLMIFNDAPETNWSLSSFGALATTNSSDFHTGIQSVTFDPDYAWAELRLRLNSTGYVATTPYIRLLA